MKMQGGVARAMVRGVLVVRLCWLYGHVQSALAAPTSAPTSVPTSAPTSAPTSSLERGCPTLASETLVHVMGQSGKFTIYSAEEGKDAGVVVTIDELKELDASGNAVGTSGSMDSKHSINSFATQSFTIEDPVDVNLPGTNVAATRISFSSPLNTIGEIQIDTYVVKECGRAGPPGEEWDVLPGDLKWNIQLKNWNWCGCAQGGGPNAVTEVGEMIDVVISVKGKGSISKKGGSDKSLDLGGGASMELSNQVQLDGGDWAAMPQGYPSVTLQGQSSVFTFRFPTFTKDALYDPVMTGVSPLIYPTTTVQTSPANDAGTSTTASSSGAVSGSTTGSSSNAGTSTTASSSSNVGTSTMASSSSNAGTSTTASSSGVVGASTTGSSSDGGDFLESGAVRVTEHGFGHLLGVCVSALVAVVA